MMGYQCKVRVPQRIKDENEESERHKAYMRQEAITKNIFPTVQSIMHHSLQCNEGQAVAVEGRGLRVYETRNTWNQWTGYAVKYRGEVVFWAMGNKPLLIRKFCNGPWVNDLYTLHKGYTGSVARAVAKVTSESRSLEAGTAQNYRDFPKSC